MVASSTENGAALAAMAVLLVAVAGGMYFRRFIPEGLLGSGAADRLCTSLDFCTVRFWGW